MSATWPVGEQYLFLPKSTLSSVKDYVGHFAVPTVFGVLLYISFRCKSFFFGQPSDVSLT